MSGRKRLSPEVRQEKLDAAHERLVDAVAGLVSSEDWTRYLKAMSRFHGYSAANVAMIMSQRPDAELVAGYRTWQAMGRQVHKGVKGIAIWSPVVRRIETEDPESGEVEMARRRTGFRLAYVFDVTDTEGDEIPLPPARARLLEGDAPDGMWDFLAAQVAEAGYTLAVIPLVPGRPSANGETDFLTRQVVVAAEGRSPALRRKPLPTSSLMSCCTPAGSRIVIGPRLRPSRWPSWSVTASGSTRWTTRSATCRAGHRVAPTRSWPRPELSSSARRRFSPPQKSQLARRWPEQGLILVRPEPSVVATPAQSSPLIVGHARRSWGLLVDSTGDHPASSGRFGAPPRWRRARGSSARRQARGWWD